MERKTLFWLAVGWSFFIGIACLVDGSSVPKIPMLAIPYKDKIVHFVFYFIFSALWFFYLIGFKKEQSKIRSAITVFVIASLMGIVVEILQFQLTVSRNAEWADVIANCSGSLISLVLCLLIMQFKK